MRKTTVWLLCLGGAAALAGCSQQTLSSAQHDVQHDITVANQAAKKAAAAARPQLKKAGLGAQVAAALQAADVHGVRVDAGPDGVTLVGRVDSPADKARAVHIAQDTLGPGKVVRSRIVVGGQ
ncbi:MAG: BON domain-containing protein [Armatimonadetes bacterium]|nr:BON domain-containing protein [Armatimonadota bacterium]